MIPIGFFQLLDAAEIPSRRRARVGRAESPLHVVVGQPIEMAADLVVQISIVTTRTEHRDESLQHGLFESQ